MASWWDYYNKVPGTTIALCLHCTYSKDLGPSRSTGCLANHLKNHHPEMYERKMVLSAAQKEQQAVKMDFARKRQADIQEFSDLEAVIAKALPSTSSYEGPSPKRRLPYIPTRFNKGVVYPPNKKPMIKILSPMTRPPPVITIQPKREIPVIEIEGNGYSPKKKVTFSEEETSTPANDFETPMSQLMHKVHDAMEAVGEKVSDVLHGHHHHDKDKSTEDSDDVVSPLHDSASHHHPTSHSSKNRGHLARKMTIEEERGGEYFL